MISGQILIVLRDVPPPRMPSTTKMTWNIFRQHRASQDVDGASLLAVVSHAEACVCVDLVFFWNDMKRHHETGQFFSNHRVNQWWMSWIYPPRIPVANVTPTGWGGEPNGCPNGWFFLFATYAIDDVLMTSRLVKFRKTCFRVFPDLVWYDMWKKYTWFEFGFGKSWSTGWWFQIFFIFTPYLGKIPILTSIFFKWVETTT